MWPLTYSLTTMENVASYSLIAVENVASYSLIAVENVASYSLIAVEILPPPPPPQTHALTAVENTVSKSYFLLKAMQEKTTVLMSIVQK